MPDVKLTKNESSPDDWFLFGGPYSHISWKTTHEVRRWFAECNNCYKFLFPTWIVWSSSKYDKTMFMALQKTFTSALLAGVNRSEPSNHVLCASKKSIAKNLFYPLGWNYPFSVPFIKQTSRKLSTALLKIRNYAFHKKDSTIYYN